MEHARHLRIFIFARVLVTFLFFASTVALFLKEPEAINDFAYNGVVRLMAFSFFFSVISYLFSKKQKTQHFITYLQTIWDLLFVTVLLLFTGGVTSPYSFLYLLSILNAGVLLGRREAIYTASLCGILFGAISDFQFFGYLEPIGLSQITARQLGATHILYTIFLNLIGFYLTCYLTGYLAEQARKNADALVTKSINFDELERLNSTIVDNVESGLITLTRDSKIRVFNPYAAGFTEKTLEEVYDTPLNSAFPAMARALGNLEKPCNGEFVCQIPGKEPTVLGFSCVPFTDTQGEQAGAIINFKDLTLKKRLEEALGRRDKLAVLGELAARMAHEIRNPLAAMSGSVQLLADHGAVTENDQRLLSIIVRETERLNALISNFLVYARPISPQKTVFLLRGFVEDMLLLICSDRRLIGIEFVNLAPDGLAVNADMSQLQQVFMNLLNNSAEASPHGGTITINATHVNNPETQGKGVSIVISDTGAGISEDAAAHLFEPFWTTKSNGTGLGLAITYRIIEEHGGTIKADSPPGGGCRISMVFPD